MLNFLKKNKPKATSGLSDIAIENDSELQALLKKVRRIEIMARHMSADIMAGNYHSAFKGRGMSFSEVREYSYGDDVRNIDWNVSARFNHPYIKVYEEERELTLMLLIDISASNMFGTQEKSKQNLIAEISATLAFSAIKNNDLVGAILFSDKVKKYIAPAKGPAHVLRIIRELLSLKKDDSSATNVASALQYLNATQKRKTIAFLLSDFISTNYEKDLKVSARKHNLNGIMLYDEAERSLPSVGIVKMKDLETQQEMYVDSSSHSFQKNLQQLWEKNYLLTKSQFEKSKARFVALNTNDDYIKMLQKILHH